MDANDRLRRYLEQRREVGESELVLDALPLEDVLAMLGAKPGTRPRSVSDTAPPAPRAAERPIDASPSSSTTTPASPPRVRRTVASEDLVDLGPSDSSEPVASPPTPEVRFSTTDATDWRQVLRPERAEPNAAAAAAFADPQINAPASAHLPPDRPLPLWLAALGLPLGLSTGTARAERQDAAATLPTLEAVAAAAKRCTRCALHESATNAVPGEGNPQAEFLCVGEAPGANEDLQGRPFVGDAGQLLTKILGAIQLQRDEVYICNVLKHRPPGNRDPLPDEVAACQPFLLRQLELVRPRVILALGRFAAQTLLHTATPIGKLRGQLHRFHGIPLIVTYHPAALLRNEEWKRPTWDDVKLARRVLDASRAGEPRADEPRRDATG